VNPQSPVAGFVIFNGMNSLDFIGAFSAITQLRIFFPEFRYEVCAPTSEVADDRGLRIVPTQAGLTLADFDLLVVPGGRGTRSLRSDEAFLEWLQTGAQVPLKVSVCTGALLLGAAGWLKGRNATTHPGAYDLLAPYCSAVVDDRVVDTGDIITGRGVSASIDVGLHVVKRLAGPEARVTVARNMDYPY
jgi:cyclohexyl-isocyanide hydratase